MMSQKRINNNLKNNSLAKDEVKLSIVVPCCNVEKYLEQCLESIVNQTLKNIEILCINDGSKDATLSIIEKYKKNDSRIKIIDKSNSGYGDSMNKGFALASGQYIGIVESDDFIEPTMFETLYNIAIKYDADVVKSNFWFYWSNPEKNELHEYFKKEECNVVIKPSEYDKGSLFGRKPSIWSAIYKRSFIEKNSISFLPTPGASYQDTSFTFKVYSLAERMVCLYDAFLHYRQDNENSSINNADKKAHCVFDEYEEIEKYINSHPTDKKKLLPIYGRIFYDTCIWMYERLGTKKKYEFLKDVSYRFKKIIDEIGIENLDFGNEWWKSRDIVRIANNPFEYHMWRHVERYEQIGATWTYALPITKINNAAAVQCKQAQKRKKPFFSIIVPVYNNEMYLRACLDSLLFQSFKDFEVICVNDGSDDHSLSILEEYADLDDRFIIINQSNSGPAKARNVGMEIGIGEYILFLDSDDYYAENTCERVYKEIQNKNNPEAVIFGTEIFPAVPRASEWHYKVLTTPDQFYDRIEEKVLLTTPYLKIYSWRCCYKHSFIKENNISFYVDFRYGEDALFMLETMCKLKGVSVISDKLYNYRHINSKSLMNQILKDNIKFCEVQLKILAKMLSVARENGISISTELMEYSCDFIYGSISNCPEPHRKEYIYEFVTLCIKTGLDKCVDSASDNCRGFWQYCYNEHLIIKNGKKFKIKFRNVIKKILPPSRQSFYDYSSKVVECIMSQQNSVEILQNQVAALQKQNQKVEWYCKELIKKYNDDKLWQMPEIIGKLDTINSVMEINNIDVDIDKEN